MAAALLGKKIAWDPLQLQDFVSLDRQREFNAFCASLERAVILGLVKASPQLGSFLASCNARGCECRGCVLITATGASIKDPDSIRQAACFVLHAVRENTASGCRNAVHLPILNDMLCACKAGGVVVDAYLPRARMLTSA